MQHDRNESLKKQIIRHAADFYGRESNHRSLITVTNCNMSPDSKRVTVLVSVLPESEENKAVEFMNRRRDDFRDYLKKNFKTKIIPYVTIEVDRGEKNRQMIDQLLKTG